MKTIEEKIEEMRARLIELGECHSERGDIQEVQAAACAAFGMKFDELVCESRTQRSVSARWASYKVCREYLKATLDEIGKAHKKDHGTVLHGLQKFDKRFQGDSDFRKGYGRTLLALGLIERVGQ